MSRVLTIVEIGRWRLDVWADMDWRWLPTRTKLWSGKLIYYSWLCFELVHDKRGNIIDEWAGPNREVK